MKKQNNLRQLFFASLLATLMIPSALMAQDGVESYKIGEKVEYKAGSYPETWKEGTVVKLYPEYKQLLIRWDTDPNYPSGYQQGYGIADVRHIKAADPPPVAENADIGKTPVNPDAAAERNETVNGGDNQELMTKEEILGYMRANGYAGGRPKKDGQVCRDLIEQIKRRGVTEPLTVKDDLLPIAENGCFSANDTDVLKASEYNIGTPTTTDWLAGTWIMYVVGGTVDTAPGDGYVYRQNESIAKLGFLTINGNGTYVWKVDPSDPPASYVKGSWRAATKEEMQLQGGAGIVLQNGAEGRDWIAYKYMIAAGAAERIDVQDLQYRGAHRRLGWRK